MKNLKSLFPVLGTNHPIASQLKSHDQNPEDCWLIVNDKDGRLRIPGSLRLRPIIALVLR